MGWLGALSALGLCVGLAAAARAADPEVAYSLDPNTPITGKTEGWSFVPSDPSGFNPAEGYYPDKGGRLQGPLVPVQGNTFYRLRFTLRVRERIYWGLQTFNADRSARIADNYGSHFGYGRQTLSRLIFTENDTRFIQPFFQSLRGLEAWGMEIVRLDPEGAMAEFAALAEGLPPLAFKAPGSLAPQLPRTFAALKDGKPWKVVLLGDSIINDTFNSCFLVPLRERHPRLNWQVVSSVRGGTGCWYYREPEAFKAFVADYKPDLLVIGGISQKNIESIREVAERAVKELGAELLLLSGPMREDKRPVAENRRTAFEDPFIGLEASAPPAPTEIGLQLAAYAKERNFAFGDMERAWNEYLYASRTPRNFFHRDRVHANEFGKSVLARIFAELMR